MFGFPAFDGGLSAWCILAILLVLGATAAIAGWLRLNLGLGAAGMVVVLSAALWAAPALSQDDTVDLDALLKSAEANVAREQAGMVQWANGLKDRAGGYTGQAASVQAASQTQLRSGAVLMDDPDLRRVQPDAARVQSDGGIYVAVSLSMPPEALRALARDAHKAGARVVIRGLVDGSFKATLIKVREVFDDRSAGGVAIDPQVFKAFHVTAVPAIIAARSPVEPCGKLGCSPEIPPFDVVSGNTSREAALKILADEGENGQAAARAARARLTD